MRLGSHHFTSDATMNFSSSRSRAANKLSKNTPEEEEERKKKEKKKRGSHLGSFGILFIAAVKLSGNAAMNICESLKYLDSHVHGTVLSAESTDARDGEKPNCPNLHQQIRMNCIFVCPRNTCPVFSTFPNTHKERKKKKKNRIEGKLIIFILTQFLFSPSGLLSECLCLIARNSSFVRLSPLHFTSDAAMNFSTSKSRAANKNQAKPCLKKKKEKEEKKKKRRFTSWILRYLVYSCCKVVWKCSDEYRELNLMPDITPGKKWCTGETAE
ncbi:hypothetical protein CEXT_456041 [Caerostris extrusa]|uniref:Uncharacterized protein n=1 Tax=Caerostris extrusa TaxID=172846 RepID=A0AAV4YFY6_CAEEX|nr:hypothetical protein CEXT_456041 [Caerostris extrusa]